jgi:hypothetical protein
MVAREVQKEGIRSMRLRLLDLDGSITSQERFLAKHAPQTVPMDHWAPYVRLACSFGRFSRFERELGSLLVEESRPEPAITLYGSGDFHHVSLALIRRLRTPVNLLVLDNHPDWMRGIPFLHCGTWLYHAARLPHVHRVFHVGGDVDFDNYYQPLAPWSMIRSGKIVVFPAMRQFSRGGWTKIPNQLLRSEPGKQSSHERLAELLQPFRAELACRPLYISLDKDVMTANEVIVNWDSGHLGLAEVQAILTAFLDYAGRNLAGMDIVGDWSPVKVRGGLRRLMHLMMHPGLEVDPVAARQKNEEVNLKLVECTHAALSGATNLIHRGGTSRKAS